MEFTGGEAALGHGSVLELDRAGDFTIQANLPSREPVHLIADVYGYFETPVETGPVEAAGSSLVLADGIHPGNDRGVDPGKLYEFGGVDNINVMNGNLGLALPVGDSYPVGGGLAYGFQLSYNSKIWDYRLRRIPAAGRQDTGCTTPSPFPIARRTRG